MTLVLQVSQMKIYSTNKLRDGVVSATHKNTPRSLKLTDEEQAILVEKLSGYKSKVYNAIVTCGVLSDIVEAEYKKASLAIIKRQEEVENMKESPIVRDAGKVLTLRFTSSINQAIIAGKSYSDEILPIFCNLVFLFNNLFKDYDDNHYYQVVIKIKTTLDVAGNKMEEYKEEFEKWIKKFENRELATVNLQGDWTPQYDQELQEKLKQTDTINVEKWEDVYHSNSFGVVYQDFLSK